jgi:two-component system, NtrC family, sensor kinase
MAAMRENSTNRFRQLPQGIEIAGNSCLESLAWSLADFPDPVVLADNQPRIIFFNRAARELFGLGPAKDVSVDIDKTLPHDLKSRLGTVIVSCLNGGELHQTPLYLKLPDGGSLNLSVTAQIITDHEGNPIGCLAIFRDLQPDLMAQPEIKSKISLLDSILKNFPTPFFMVDNNLRITEMNSALETLTGYSRQEVVGRKTCAEILCTKLCNTNDCLLRQAMENRLPVTGIRQIIADRSGKEIPVVVNASVITDAENNIIGGFEFIRDISHRVETEEKLNLVTELTQEGILLVDEQFRIIFANSKMAAITGIPKEELIGMTADKVIPAYYYQTMMEMMQEIDQGVQLCFCSIIKQPNDESDNYRNYETCMALSTIGKRLVTSLYFRDLSQRNEYERELRQAKSFLENIIRSSVDGIVVVDIAGNVLFFNEGAERILGYKAEEVIGHTKIFQKFYEPDQAREIMRRMRSNEYGPPGKLTTTRLIFKSKTGEEIPVNFSAAIIKEGEREIGSVGIFSDRRENVRIRKELDEAKRQLWQAEKIASLGRLAAAVAHEINNPLAGILIYADMLRRDIADNQQWREDLDEIRHQTLRCKQIVTRLLEFSRMPLAQRISFNVNEVVKTCVEFLCHQAIFHNIEFDLDLEDDLPNLVGDPSQLQQVFTNIIINAANAMEGKGKITVSSICQSDNKEVVLTFKDTGPGIPATIIDKIFEPFFTTKAPGEGTGLGLSVCYGIVQQHGGDMEAKNSPEGGAIFILTLPLEAPQHEEMFELVEQ